MSPDQRERLLSELERSSEAVATACVSHLDSPVQHCDGWTVSDLAIHLGNVQWFWNDVMQRSALTLADVQHPPGPPQGADVATYLRGETSQLITSLSERADDHHIWTWWEAEQNLGWLLRRQVLEAAVHGWDANNAVGEPAALPVDIAVLGLTEFCEVMAANLIEGADPANSIELVPSDNAWRGTVQLSNAAPLATHGTASDLLLTLWGRREPTDPRIAEALASVDLS